MLNMISGLARTLYIVLAIVAGFVALGTMNMRVDTGRPRPDCRHNDASRTGMFWPR